MATNRDIRNIYFWSPRWLTLWCDLATCFATPHFSLVTYMSAPLIIKSVCRGWMFALMLLLFMPLQGFTEGSCPNHSERTTVVRNEGFPQDRSLGSSWGARLDHCGRFARSHLIALHPIVAHSREAGRQNVAVILHTTLRLTKFIFMFCNKIMVWRTSKYEYFLPRPLRAVSLNSLPRELIHDLELMQLEEASSKIGRSWYHYHITKHQNDYVLWSLSSVNKWHPHHDVGSAQCMTYLWPPTPEWGSNLLAPNYFE